MGRTAVLPQRSRVRSKNAFILRGAQDRRAACTTTAISNSPHSRVVEPGLSNQQLRSSTLARLLFRSDGVLRCSSIEAVSCRVINLEEGRPTVNVGLLRLDHALSEARADRVPLLKLIHGYGSSGVGGELREQVWKALDLLLRNGRIVAYIPGEDFRESNDASWKLVKRDKAIRNDHDFGRGNRGITIVVLE